MMVPYYLMASYAYYVEDDPIFSDSFYDDMSKTMIQMWDEIQHYHKHIIDIDALSAGSFLGEYPSIIPGALESLRAQHIPKKLKKQIRKQKIKNMIPAEPADTGLFDWGNN